MAIKSLNEIYEKNGLLYMCNACGDINDPNVPGDTKTHLPEEVMTPEEQVLYESYWTEDGGCCMYVLNVEGKAAMGLCYLFDTGWCRDVVDGDSDPRHSVSDEDIERLWMPQVFTAITDASSKIQELVPGCDIYLGEWTDPDGHEMLVVVPYEMRDQIKGISQKLYDTVYETVEKVF